MELAILFVTGIILIGLFMIQPAPIVESEMSLILTSISGRIERDGWSIKEFGI